MTDAIIIHGHVYELRPAETAPCANCALEQFCDGYLESTPLCTIHDGGGYDTSHLRYVEVEPSTVKEERPKEVYLCILRHDDGRFKMICGCFYDRKAAERYAAGSPRITIQEQSVV